MGGGAEGHVSIPADTDEVHALAPLRQTVIAGVEHHMFQPIADFIEPGVDLPPRRAAIDGEDGRYVLQQQ